MAPMRGMGRPSGRERKVRPSRGRELTAMRYTGLAGAVLLATGSLPAPERCPVRGRRARCVPVSGPRRTPSALPPALVGLALVGTAWWRLRGAGPRPALGADHRHAVGAAAAGRAAAGQPGRLRVRLPGLAVVRRRRPVRRWRGGEWLPVARRGAADLAGHAHAVRTAGRAAARPDGGGGGRPGPPAGDRAVPADRAGGRGSGRLAGQPPGDGVRCGPRRRRAGSVS